MILQRDPWVTCKEKQTIPLIMQSEVKNPCVYEKNFTSRDVEGMASTVCFVRRNKMLVSLRFKRLGVKIFIARV